MLKGSKYFWLETPADFRTRCAAEFRALLAKDLQTGMAWMLKENFRHFWSFRTVGRAMKFVSNWVDAVRASGLEPMIEAAEMVVRHLDGILNNLVVHRPLPGGLDQPWCRHFLHQRHP